MMTMWAAVQCMWGQQCSVCGGSSAVLVGAAVVTYKAPDKISGKADILCSDQCVRCALLTCGGEDRGLRVRESE